MTRISLWPNWVVESPCDCLLDFPCCWSIVIHYQDLSAILSFFVSSKPFESQFVPFSAAHFTVRSPAIRVQSMRFNYRISLNMEGNYTAGLIAVNSTSCQQSSHPAVTQLQFDHKEIALNRAIISSKGSYLQLFFFWLLWFSVII